VTAAVCVVAWLAGLVFVLALCKAAHDGDEMNRTIYQSYLQKEEE
jgi:hypothetical protein